MFATPFSAPLHQALVSHIFGRFMPSQASVAVGASESAEPSAPEAATTAGPAPDVAVDDEAWPDLAQRVREVGEW